MTILQDEMDQRLIDEVKTNTGPTDTILDEADVGGFPALEAGTPYADSDKDGMADEWEVLHGFDANDPSDGPVDSEGDGYTNVEEFLNASDPWVDSYPGDPTPGVPTGGGRCGALGLEAILFLVLGLLRKRDGNRGGAA